MAIEARARLGSCFVVLCFLMNVPRGARADEPEPAPAASPDEATVDVRGQKADTLERSTGSGTQISQKDIEHAQPQSTQEMFRRVPGVNLRTEDGMGLRLNLGIRGMNPTRSRLVLLQEDGVPVVVSPYGEPELYWSTPIERVERVDVLKGPEVLLDGPQTVGGVVNLYTWTPPTHRTWSVEADYGQRDYVKGLVRYGDVAGDLRYVVQVFHKEGDGFRNMPFAITDGMAKLVYPTGKGGEATLKISGYDEVSHTTYVGLTQPMYQQDPRQDNVAPDDITGIRRYEISLHHEQPIGENTILRTTLFAYTVDLKLYQQDFDRTRIDNVEVQRVLGPQGVEGSALYFRNTRTLRDRVYRVAGIEPQVETRFATGAVPHRLIVGARAMADVATRRQSTASTPTAETGDLQTDDTTSIAGLAAYAEDRLALRDWLLVTPGIRVEHSNSHRKTARVQESELVNGVPTTVYKDESLTGDSSNTGVIPGVAFAAGNPKLNLFWGIHSGYSPPRVSQSITPTGGDNNLSAERSMNYELGGRARPLPWMRAEVTGFVTTFDNQLISNNTLSGSSAEFVNGGKTRHLGAELTLLTHFGAKEHVPLETDFQVQYTYVNSKFSDGPWKNNFVPYSPEHTLTATVDSEHRSGIGAQVSFSFVGTQFADETNTVEPDISGRAGRIPAFEVLDLGARYLHRPTGLSFHLNVKSALDDVYLSGRLPNGIFTGGYRQIFGGIKWQGG